MFEALQKVNYNLGSLDPISRQALIDDIEYIVSNIKNIDGEPEIPSSWFGGSSYGTGRHESSENTKLKILAALPQNTGKTVDLQALKTELKEREELELQYDTHM